jgi:putative DNA primase/helicase
MNSISTIDTFNSLVRNKYSRLSREHQEHIAERGLLDNNWTEMTCYTTSAKNAPAVLGYPAMSGGIMFWGYNNQYQFRPDTPWESEDGESPKYRTPKGGYDALLLRHLTDDRYWEPDHLKEVCWKINGHPCILVTEGGFKAIAGCSNGIPTIALLGVEMGLTGAKHNPDNKRYLVPSIKKYAEAGLGFIITFDADATSNPDIHRAEKTLALALKEYNVPVYTVTGHWKVEDGKGMDDFIQNKGIEAFRAVLIKAESVDVESLDTSHSKKAKHPSADAMARTIAEDYRDRLKFNNTNLCWYRYEADSPGIWSPETDEYIESVVYQIVKSKGLTNLPPTYTNFLKLCYRYGI